MHLIQYNTSTNLYMFRGANLKESSRTNEYKSHDKPKYRNAMQCNT
jgi:hypothetical protein